MPFVAPPASLQPSNAPARSDDAERRDAVDRPLHEPPARGRSRTVGLRVFWLLACLALLFPAAAMAPQPVAAGSCTGWTSLTRPPDTIRVLSRSGQVEKVKFRSYVGKVMATGEWPASLPRAMLETGAVAVKQFAWYHALKGNHRSSYISADGDCYDVSSTTRDQLYKAGASVSRKQWRAIDSTWSLSIRKNGRFMLTQYNAGSATTCGADANGKVIKQRSAKDCARKGYSAKEILRTYYGPNVTFKGSGGGGDSPTTTAKPEPKPKADRKPKRDRKPRQRATPTPTPDPEVEVVPWWEVALGEKPEDGGDADGPVSGVLAQAGTVEPLGGEATQPALPRSGEIRIATAGAEGGEFPPLIARAARGAEAAKSTTAVSFLGRSMRLAAVPGPGGKVVGVYVDGELAAMIDMYWSEAFEEVVVFEREWEEEQLHTVRLVLMGTTEQLRLELDANQLHY